MSKPKPRFTIPTGSTLVPKNDRVSYVPGDEDKLRTALSHDDIDAMIAAGHLTPADDVPAADVAPVVAAPVTAPAPSKG